MNAFLFVAGPGDWGGGVVRISLPVLPFFLFAGGTYLLSLLLLDRDWKNYKEILLFENLRFFKIKVVLQRCSRYLYIALFYFI